mmetsp:Transcript_2120/g.4436  ORF Transcript_2120/g.4436 Transcript_2120/m.4436 type:complete len:254 (+) Transcript_2120:240-1001(+)
MASAISSVPMQRQALYKESDETLLQAKSARVCDENDSAPFFLLPLPESSPCRSSKLSLPLMPIGGGSASMSAAAAAVIAVAVPVAAVLGLEDALDVDHALLAHVECPLEALNLLLVALHDDVARRLVVGGDDLDAHLVDALSVVEVVLTRERRHQRREVPPVAQTLAFAEDALLEDGEDERERAEREEDARREEGRAARQRRLHALEDDHVARVLDLVVVRLKESHNVASYFTSWSSIISSGSRHLIYLAHNF